MSHETGMRAALIAYNDLEIPWPDISKRIEAAIAAYLAATDLIESQSREIKRLERLVDWYQAEYVNNPPSLPHGIEQDQSKGKAADNGDHEQDQGIKGK